MKILVVRFSDTSGNDSANIRTNNLVQGLIELGHQIDYITLNKKNKKDDENIRYIEVIRSASYEKLKEKESNNKAKKFINIIRKMYHKFSVFDNSFFILKKIKLEELKLEKDYDRLITISDPKTSHLLTSKLLKEIHFGMIIQYWGDPLAVDITQKSIYPKSYLKLIEKNILNNSDKIVYVSPITLIDQQKLFPTMREKMFFVPPSFSTNKVNITEENHEKVEVNISYVGAYNSKIRNIMPLYEALINNEGTKSYIVGDSDLNLKSKNNLTVLPRMDAAFIEQKSFLHICLLNKEGGQIPSKLYYLMSGTKPILVILDGDRQDEIREYLESYNRFYFCSNNNKEIIKAINLITSLAPTYEALTLLSPRNIAEQIVREEKNER